MYTRNGYWGEVIQDVGDGYRAGSRNLYWLAFFVISVLSHVAMLKDVKLPTMTHNRDTVGAGRLTVIIEATLPQTEKTRAPDLAAARKIESKATEANNTTHSPKRDDSQDPVSNAEKPAIKLTTEQPRAAALIESAFEAVPDIASKLEAERELAKPNEIFDPHFRNKLESSRKEKELQKKVDRLRSKPEYTEVTAYYDDYIGIRIGEKCWRAPVEKAPDPFDNRIWMADTNCPKRPKVNFFSEAR